MTEAETAWLAGILEGEGSFGESSKVTKHHAKYRYPRVRLAMCDQDIVERARDLTGPRKVSACNPNQPHYQIQYRLIIEAGPAVDLMRAIRPYMGKRRGARIDGLLERYGHLSGNVPSCA
jgi:hypothetical protein